MDRYQAYVDANRERFLDELTELCALPTISAQGMGLDETAALVEHRLQSLGAHVRRFDYQGGAPILWAELGQGARTMLIYNHYDVQPPDPLDEWESPPFEPTIRDGRFYARGVADNKGDLLCRLQAIEAYQAALGPVPLRLTFLIEGEEEVGSPHLDEFSEQYPDLMESDGCLWETGEKDAAGRPILSLGVKGLCYVELSCRTASNDLHSMWGGIVPNAAWRLIWALNTLKDADDRILVEGFADRVRPPTDDEWAQLRTIPFDEETVKSDFGFSDFVGGLSGPALLKKLFYEPTCTICGLRSGYIGEGGKTVLPCEASAKVGFRLVADLTPELVPNLLRAHLDRHGFADIEVVRTGGIMPARSNMDAPFVGACIAAAKATYGKAPVIHPTSPGSGPLHTLCRGTPAVMAGVGHMDSRLHAPNENIYVEDYFNGIRFFAELMRCFAH